MDTDLSPGTCESAVLVGKTAFSMVRNNALPNCSFGFQSGKVSTDNTVEPFLDGSSGLHGK